MVGTVHVMLCPGARKGLSVGVQNSYTNVGCDGVEERITVGSPERVDNGQFLFDNLSVIHVLGVEEVGVDEEFTSHAFRLC